ncbi:hypothetical protein BDF21DRAFT_426853 [Thamnidium elegans]|uniref:Uncharacterized protein n=1 Tax=Thamnidium elegans TaxID=101142 RepID=A0A8H7VVM3_9FUNG|nr:hypothetical protein INT48_005386 [Thamnidium elegans]KAI8066000.1 hypothetical protein BDF21DRAFT_426853 [Thamnidium elegans]
MALFSIKKTALYNQDSLTKKARTSLCNLLSSSLKRKRSFEEEEQQPIAKKKKKVNTIAQLFQKIILSSSNTIKRDKSELLFDALYKFETFSLPTIEATDGSLGIIMPKEPEESIFNTIEGTFPIPPPTTRRLRRDSCPPRLNSLVMIEEESDDDDTLPLTPSSSNVEYELLTKILELNINAVS